MTLGDFKTPTRPVRLVPARGFFFSPVLSIAAILATIFGTLYILRWVLS